MYLKKRNFFTHMAHIPLVLCKEGIHKIHTVGPQLTYIRLTTWRRRTFLFIWFWIWSGMAASYSTFWIYDKKKCSARGPPLTQKSLTRSPTSVVLALYTQVGDFSREATVALMQILRNAVSLKSQNPRNAGTLCGYRTTGFFK